MSVFSGLFSVVKLKISRIVEKQMVVSFFVKLGHLPLCLCWTGLQSVLTAACTIICLKTSRPGASAARREVFVDLFCTTSTQVQTLLLQQTGFLCHQTVAAGLSSILFSRSLSLSLPPPPATLSSSPIPKSSCNGLALECQHCCSRIHEGHRHHK